MLYPTNLKKVQETIFWAEERNKHSRDWRRKKNKAIIIKTQSTSENGKKNMKNQHGDPNSHPSFFISDFIYVFSLIENRFICYITYPDYSSPSFYSPHSVEYPQNSKIKSSIGIRCTPPWHVSKGLTSLIRCFLCHVHCCSIHST